MSRLRAEAYVPLEYAYRVKEGQVVEIQPRLTPGRGEPLPIEKKRFRGKITFVDPQIQPVAETAVRIRAEFENPGDLRPGLMVQMTIFLPQDVAAAAPEAGAPDPDGALPVIRRVRGDREASGPSVSAPTTGSATDRVVDP